MSRKGPTRLLLTQRALGDIQAIYDYSVGQWGKGTAETYLDDLEAGLDRLRAHRELLKPEADLPDSLQFYRVNKHVLVCDVGSQTIVVLTVLHASMDLPRRLAELEPALAVEAAIFHRRLRGRGK